MATNLEQNPFPASDESPSLVQQAPEALRHLKAAIEAAPWIAVITLVGIVIGLIATTMLSDARSAIRRLEPRKPPAALVVEARELLSEIGHDEPIGPTQSGGHGIRQEGGRDLRVHPNRVPHSARVQVRVFPNHLNAGNLPTLQRFLALQGGEDARVLSWTQKRFKRRIEERVRPLPLPQRPLLHSGGFHNSRLGDGR